MEDLKELLEIYTAYPSRTLPNAFWKTAARRADIHLKITRDSAGQPSSLVLWEGQCLMAFWCADPAIHPLTREEIARVPFALVHADGLTVFSERDFTHRSAYFRLVTEGNSGYDQCPTGFAFEKVNPKVDILAMVRLIRTCYLSINITPKIVQSWLDHPVYDPDLWLWVVDISMQAKAGLGIAERDPLVPEVSLEWVQVHPAYQKRGLGKAIVSELIRRASGDVKFITVSGEMENDHQPEKLYRGCGFTGNDIWWLLSD